MHTYTYIPRVCHFIIIFKSTVLLISFCSIRFQNNLNKYILVYSADQKVLYFLRGNANNFSICNDYMYLKNKCYRYNFGIR